MDVLNTLKKFDEYLSKRQVKFNAVVIGGAALNIMGVIKRDTADVDCLDPTIPVEILKYAAEFRIANPELNLIEMWINNGPASLVRDLPKGWRNSLISIYEGESLNILTLSRLDFLRSKLFAYCDRDQDLQDCIAMQPSIEELDLCFSWVSERDANPTWPENVRNHFSFLKKRLGYGEK